MSESRFKYEVGKRYQLFGSWSNYRGTNPEVGKPLVGECTHVAKETGRGHIARVDADGNVHRQDRWSFRCDGYALMSGEPTTPPIAVVLYELPREKRTIVIDGKTITISEESFQSLRRELCK